MVRYGYVCLCRLGRLGLCVCQTKTPKQRWVQQLVPNKVMIRASEDELGPSIETGIIGNHFKHVRIPLETLYLRRLQK
jgi:hypothetical protein